MASSTCLISHSSSFQKVLSRACADNVIFVTFFIGAVHTSYAFPILLIFLLEKNNCIFNLGSISRSILILCLRLPSKSSTWKFRVILFVTFSSGSTISTLLWCFVWNSPPWVFQWTSLVFFIRRLFFSLPYTMEHRWE